MDILSKEHIFINKELTDKNSVIKLIAERAEQIGVSDDGKELTESFMERENLGATGMGEGIAIPHAKSNSAKKVAVMIVKSQVPIQWESLDNEPVYLVIALIVPKENPDNIHLKVLSSVSRKLVNEEFKNNIFNAQTPEEILSLFQGITIE